MRARVKAASGIELEWEIKRLGVSGGGANHGGGGMSGKFSHVAVLMGGWSAEREVSLNSGKACADALEGEGFRVTRIDVDRHLPERLRELAPDVCFNALHGKGGEDGTVQGILEVLQIPYTHSGVLASAMAMKRPRRRSCLPTPALPSPITHRAAPRSGEGAVMPPPYVIKPVAEGSSVGVFIVREDHAHPPQQLTSSEWAFAEDSWSSGTSPAAN